MYRNPREAIHIRSYLIETKRNDTHVRVIESLGKSDHSQIQFCKQGRQTRAPNKKGGTFRKETDGMRQYAQNKKWKLLLKIKGMCPKIPLCVICVHSYTNIL